ncbi:hypothetical protein SERLA73DRAFT_175848 [Serpula lacrymans var. lacrymans S7.3]|uniref:Uncharacterized protein n=2 Tax=Serpula lacrymans var. lacrymans TaxID=341189 RepID=F8PJF3_SERL3|nr:uncharacterized protein SERLADRAFT_458462 [Serpula lacrymans var. lacrymans S7.9]EGO04091.1 hypothetical protein SERLA73DRAFT_175848 [Serpula lacrymans var. lacrymans S7.3]EGO30012.1 hypothetical protein SERLADRAFT_458462 [Serpula lacrymans var. lacrymans S7.9]
MVVTKAVWNLQKATSSIILSKSCLVTFARIALRVELALKENYISYFELVDVRCDLGNFSSDICSKYSLELGYK